MANVLISDLTAKGSNLAATDLVEIELGAGGSRKVTGQEVADGTSTILGLGSMATQASSSVSITGGSVSGITDLAVADGGTGASDAATARSNLGAEAAQTAASQAEAEAGTEAAIRSFSPLRIAQAIGALATGGGNLVGFRVFTSGTGATYTPTSGATSILVYAVGAGGGGGGASEDSCINGRGGGGGGGGCAIKRYDISSGGPTGTYTVGTAGSAGAATPGNGGTGGNSSFTWNAVTITGSGGTGGNSGTAGTKGSVGTGGTASGGDINLTGEDAGRSYNAEVTLNAELWNTVGGGSHPFSQRSWTTKLSAGTTGAHYGNGGSGAHSDTNAPGKAGGAGAPGVVIVYEFGA